MKIIWKEFWLFFCVLLLVGLLTTPFNLPWWANILIGGAVGGWWPRKFLLFRGDKP